MGKTVRMDKQERAKVSKERKARKDGRGRKWVASAA